MEKLREKKRAKLQDLNALPEHVRGEIIEGELVATPPAGSSHQFVASSLGALVLHRFQLGMGGPGGWWIVHEPGLRLGKNVLVPDLAGWRQERMPTYPDQKVHFHLAPDWVCEVLSPSTVVNDRIRKQKIYARAKVKHVWLIDPVMQCLEVYRLQRGAYLQVGLHMKRAKVRAEPFEAVSLDLSLIWVPVLADPEFEPGDPADIRL